MPTFMPSQPTSQAAEPHWAPLIVSSDPDLLDDVLRIAAVAGTPTTVVGSLSEARPHWATARVVLVGADAASVEPLQLPRRPDVLIVGRDEPKPAVWQSAVVIGAADVLTLPTESAAVTLLFSEASDGAHRGAVIALVGGRGGVGASSLAVATAIEASRSARCALVDLDAWGGGIDLLLRAEDAEGVRWSDLGPIEGRLAPVALEQAMPRVHGVSLLSCTRHGSVLEPGQVDVVLDALVRAFEVVVLDVPRAPDAAGDAALRRANAIGVVVAADVRGCAAAQTLIEHRLAQLQSLHTIVRRGPGRTLDPDDVAEAAGAPLLAVIGDDPRAPGRYERGEPPSLRTRGAWLGPARALMEAAGASGAIAVAS